MKKYWVFMMLLLMVFVISSCAPGMKNLPKLQEKAASPQSAPKPAAPQVSAGTGDEIVEMDRMRKLIADHMVMSVQVSPHVTSYIEVDVTNIVKWRDRIKNDFQKRESFSRSNTS